MITKNVDIYVPLMAEEEYEYFCGDISEAIDELVMLSDDVEVIFNKKVISKLSIKKMTCEHEEIKNIFKDKYTNSIINIFLKFSSKIEIHNVQDFEKRKEHYVSFEYFVEKYVQLLLIYSNLAKPGAFDTRDGFLKIQEVNKKNTTIINEFQMLSNSISYAIELANRYKWPPIKELSIKNTLNWLNQHWNAFESISENRIQRALNAFSYLFHNTYLSDDNSSGDLFHALVGIEAIYVDGNNNIQGQVNQKSQLLLGKRNDFKKIFNELYDYRSRYVHGQLNIVNRYFIDDNEDDAIDQILNTYDKSSFAIAILVSTLQKHIEHNKNEFFYELVVK
jgi:hypothetical protein